MKLLEIFLLVALSVAATKCSTNRTLSQLLQRMLSVEENLKASSTYCSLHANGNCGPCICRDDFKAKEKYYCDCQNLKPERDCREFYQNGLRINGIYKVNMNGFRTVQVYCDQTYAGGGWTVIQRRYDGSENFYRNWNEYKNGFGKLQREFWLGNDNIHLLTLQTIYPKGSEARVRGQRYNYYYSYYDRLDYYRHFQVDNEKTNYHLHVSYPSSKWYSSYNLYTYNNMQFSTYDRDNDKTSSYHCAYSRNYGGWWYNNCGDYYNLNGPYDKYRVRSWYNALNWGANRMTATEILVRRIL